VLLLGLLVAGCERAAEPAALKPSAAEPIGRETELLRLTLGADAERQLGVSVTPVTDGALPEYLMVHGEVVAAPVPGGLPVGAATDFATLAANQARADGELGRLQAALDVARIALERAERLVAEEAGSLRTRDEARATLAAAEANLAAARAQRDLLGPAVGRLGDTPRRWIRVASLAGDLPRIARSEPALVRSLGGIEAPVTAHPVAGPPSANYGTATIDLFYRLPEAASGLRVGERVRVDLPIIGGRTPGLLVPAAAILRDIHGGEWVYAKTGEHAYERRRVEVERLAGDRALLRRGPPAGTSVVDAGAMELFGAEFGTK
jgi:multidrug efflux pump subunit AcrA (membrane-fusion protein)